MPGDKGGSRLGCKGIGKEGAGEARGDPAREATDEGGGGKRDLGQIGMAEGSRSGGQRRDRLGEGKHVMQT